MLKRLVCLLVLLVFLSVVPAAAADSESSKIEIGLTSGFPSIVAVQFGYWGSSEFPLLARAALGMGSVVDIGVHLPIDEAGEKSLMVAATGGVMGYLGILQDVLISVGPTVGVRLGHFIATGGPALYICDGDTLLVGQAQIGLSVRY